MRRVSLLLAVTLSATLFFAGSAIWCSKVAAQQDPSDPHDSWICTENCKEEGPSIILVITADFPLTLLDTIFVTVSDPEYTIIDRLTFNPSNSDNQDLRILIGPGPHLNDRVVFRGRGKRLLGGISVDIADGVVLARFPSCPQGKTCYNEYHLHLYPRGDDFDGDGFTPALLQPTFRDCDDTTPEVRPFRSEIGGDGIDNDCNGEIR